MSEDRLLLQTVLSRVEEEPVTTLVDLRCPVGPGKLLARLRQEGEQPVVSGNLMELSCRDCSRNAREFDSTVRRVVHRFDLAGDLVESATVRD